MRRVLFYVKALFKRHALSWILFCIIPVVTGLLAVAVTTNIHNVRYAQYKKGDFYTHVATFQPMENVSTISIHGVYRYSPETPTGLAIESRPIVGRYFRTMVALGNDTKKSVTVYDADMWQHFPIEVHSGKGFSLTANEVLLDVSYQKFYKRGETYTFFMDSHSQEFVVEAVVAGFTRYNRELLGSGRALFCIPDWNLLAPTIDNVFDIRDISQEQLWELAGSKGQSSAQYYLTIGNAARASRPDENAVNTYVMAIFLLVVLSILFITTDMSVNRTSLALTERVSLRCGMRYAELQGAYAVKAAIQWVLGQCVVLAVVLLRNRVMESMLVLESMWASIVVGAILSAIAWSVDFLRLRRQKRVNG